MNVEVEKFESMSSGWWGGSGEFKLLHQINPVRLEHAASQFGVLRGKRIADVGCGGGIFSEMLVRSGADVVGFDASSGAVESARGHAKESGLDIEYRVQAAEDLDPRETGTFDGIVCFEMLEHVEDPSAVVARLGKLLRRPGKILFSTVNRTLKSYLLMIAGLERMLEAIPRGTHEFGKFIRPFELAGWCRRHGLRVADVTGLRYSLFGKIYLLDAADVSVNYFLAAELNDGD